MKSQYDQVKLNYQLVASQLLNLLLLSLAQTMR